MTVVVTDHHEVPYNDDEAGTRHYIIPDADAVIDPKRPEDDGVFKEICGAVVAWKFMGCLYRKFGKEDEFKNSDFLEIASLGTVCDVMELQHDNRAIVKEGLKKMQNTSNIGLQALLEVLGLRDKALTSYDLVSKSARALMPKADWIPQMRPLTCWLRLIIRKRSKKPLRCET